MKVGTRVKCLYSAHQFGTVVSYTPAEPAVPRGSIIIVWDDDPGSQVLFIDDKTNSFWFEELTILDEMIVG